MKKLSFFIILFLSTSMYAGYFQSGDLWYYYSSSSSTTVSVAKAQNGTNYNGLTNVVIPETVEDNGTTYNVTSIGDNAFSYCSSLESVNISEGVTSIGNGAFSDCPCLENINFPESIISIGNNAFSGCSSLTNITIPKGVTSIECYAFFSCICLESVTISESVESIDDGVFGWCESLKDVYCKAIIPPATTLGQWGNWYTFYGCSDELTIYVPMESVEAYKTAEGWSQYADQIVGFDFENGVVAE